MCVCIDFLGTLPLVCGIFGQLAVAADRKLTGVFHCSAEIFSRDEKVITMDMIGKVRRMKLRDQLSDGEICRRTRLARNTAKKWLKAPGDITPKYERKKADGKLTPFEPVLEQALRTDAHRVKHARRSGRALFAQIQAQG